MPKSKGRTLVYVMIKYNYYTSGLPKKRTEFRITLQGGQTEHKDKSSMYQCSQSNPDKRSERWKWCDDGAFFISEMLVNT